MMSVEPRLIFRLIEFALIVLVVGYAVLSQRKLDGCRRSENFNFGQFFRLTVDSISRT